VSGAGSGSFVGRNIFGVKGGEAREGNIQVGRMRSGSINSNLSFGSSISEMRGVRVWGWFQVWRQEVV
jgi:hypothetical protein